VRNAEVSNVWFKMMAAEFKVRDYFSPRQEIVDEIGLQKGFKVLDYGCGPGGYVPAVSDAIGESGKLYALDALPIALKMVKGIVAKKGLKNVETILSECATGLPSGGIDVVLMFDVFHDLGDQQEVLNEMHRVLGPNGVLSFSDHHLREDQIVSKLTASGLFKLQQKGKHTYRLSKA
jgi:ubiquinone/menaquinone biosynthesis C-methylase UbiE